MIWKKILLMGIFDTKGQELEFLKKRHIILDIGVIFLDGSVLDIPAFAADITRDSVAAAGCTGLEVLQKEKTGENQCR